MTILLAWPGGSLEDTLKLLATVLIAYVLVLWLSAVVWVYRDVRTRTHDPYSQWIAVTLVGLFNVPGLIVYLVIRPQETIADAYERSLEAEAIIQELQLEATACHVCRRPIETDFMICPYCKAVLRVPCETCGQPVRTTWAACPYCGRERAPVRLGPPQARRQQQSAAAASPTAPMTQPSRAAPSAQQQAQQPQPMRPPVRPAAPGSSTRQPPL